MSVSFGLYSTPSYSTKFSLHYFDSLTFNDCADIMDTVVATSEQRVPRILPIDHLVSFHFDAGVPTSEGETMVADGEEIPHLNDLLKITQIIESAYNEQDARSLRLFINICNNVPHINHASALIAHLRSSNILQPDRIEAFGTTRIHEHIRGFQVAQYPLYKLSCLLEENWVEDDIGDSMSKLTYLRLASFRANDSDPPFLFLPTSFFNDARVLHPGNEFSFNLIQIRDRLRTGDVEHVGYNVWTHDHD
ncbi:hypothetical protein C8R44DRAFT_726146 [Mycena epipterygia]|nr:hypothetical protein C8R44DRAFT_726146 [Mycena epipterygia]